FRVREGLPQRTRIASLLNIRLSADILFIRKLCNPILIESIRSRDEHDSDSNAEKTQGSRRERGVSSAHARQRCRGFLHNLADNRRVLGGEHPGGSGLARTPLEARRTKLLANAAVRSGDIPLADLRSKMKPTKPECEAAIRQMFEEWRFEPAQRGI